MIKNIIFDLDGTISKSKKGIVNSIKYSLDKLDVNYKGKNLEEFIGPPLLQSYEKIIGLDKKHQEKLWTCIDNIMGKVGFFKWKFTKGFIHF